MQNWRLYDDVRDQGRVTIQRAYVEDVQHVDSIQRIRGRGLARTQNDMIEHIQPVGFSSNPGGGDKVEAFFLDVVGESTHRVCLAVIGDRKKTRHVGPGEAIVYAPGDSNQHVHVTPDGVIVNAPGKTVTVRGGNVVIDAASSVTINAPAGVTVNAPTVQINGDLDVQGAIARISCPCC